jgi:mannosyltransferase
MTTITEPAQKKPGLKLPVLGTINDFTLWTPAWWQRLPQWLRITIFLVLLVAFSAHARGATLGGQYWIDEAITVGISSHHLTAIPGILRMDGSPPLFYLMLHFWMNWFGDSPKATHSLTLILGSLTIPLGYWGGASIANKRAGLMAATMFALCAFLDSYSTETRMYALMTVLGLLATIGFVNGFALRKRKYIPLWVVSQTAMFYTHAWAIFIFGASCVAIVILWFTSTQDSEFRKDFVKDVLIAGVVSLVLFIPWIPNFIFQSIHTAAPWAPRPHFGAPIQVAQGVVGSTSLTILMIAVALLGYWKLFGKELRSSPEARVVYVLAALAVFTLVFAWISSQITPAWVLRYFAPMIAALFLFMAIGMSRAGILGAIAIVVFAWGMHSVSHFAPVFKSDMQDVSAEMGPHLHKGDLVIVGQPEQVPLAYFYLPGGLKFSSTIGPVKDPTYVDWVNALKRFKNSNPSKVLKPMINNLKPGQQLLFIKPLTEGNSTWDESWTRLIRRRSAQWGQIIADDKQLVQERWAPHYYRGACCVADAAYLYKKV